MHDTAILHATKFFKTYLKNAKDLIIVDVGAQDVNGSLRSFSPPNCQYIGLDFIKAKGVEVVIDDLYSLPFNNNSVDVIVSSSCFEHSEFFWLLFNECLRILKPTGLLYINVPQNGDFHRYPVDCWRFYPDSGIALQNWGRRSGYNCVLLESFIGSKNKDIWNDFVGVFLKDELYSSRYVDRIQDTKLEFKNGRLLNEKTILNYVKRDIQDQSLRKMITNILQSILRKLTKKLWI